MMMTKKERLSLDTRYFKPGAPKGDFAAGERTLPATSKVGDFAAGEHTLPSSGAVGDFATGEHTLPIPMVVSDDKE